MKLDFMMNMCVYFNVVLVVFLLINDEIVFQFACYANKQRSHNLALNTCFFFNFYYVEKLLVIAYTMPPGTC